MNRRWNQRAGLLALGDLGQEGGLDLGGVVDTRRDAVRQQIDQELLLARRGRLQQADQFLGLLGRQRQGRNAECGTLSDMLAIGFKHG